MAKSALVTVVGLGPGSLSQLTLEAQSLLESSVPIYVRTLVHPTLAALGGIDRFRSFDARYDGADDFRAVYSGIADDLIAAARRQRSIIYAVPGHPLVGEATVRALLERAAGSRVHVRIVPGLSFVDAVLIALRQDALPGLQVLDALEVRRFDATLPLLIGQLYNRRIASNVKLALAGRYPDEHQVAVVAAAGVEGEERVEWLPLYQLDQGVEIAHLTALWVPALARHEDLRSVDTLREIMARLRSPDGCPWDRAQSHQSLRPYLLEEAYETLEAIDAADPGALEEELGDLLLQVVFHAQMAEEQGHFDLTEVAAGINGKLIRRHPHVFGDHAVGSAAEVLQNWEALKRQERQERQARRATGESMLDGVPQAMPALAYAQAVQDRAARVGFDWPDIQGVLAKVREEIDELTAETDQEGRREEFGDLLFVLVRLASWLQMDAEEALRAANRKFRARFAAMERCARERGQSLDQLDSEALDQLWRQVKMSAGGTQ